MSVLEFYEEKYAHAQKIPSEAFLLWETRAKVAINHLTFGRFASLDEYTDNEKMCICEIAENLYTQSEKKGIASENNDGYSVTYTTDENEAKTVKNIAELYLSSELLYRGF